MSTPPLDIKVDEALHNRLKNIADRNNRSLQWLTRQALVSYLEAIERGQEPPDQLSLPRADAPELPKGARVLGFAYDTGERYLSIDGFLPT